jgi:hypothetical protein
MATIERRKDALCPKPGEHGRADQIEPRDADEDPAPDADEQDYFFWGINELYVAP